MLENHELSLIVDGQAFGGWLDVRLSRGIERAAGDFQIGVTQRWPGRDARFEIPKGAACEVRIGDDKVLTGWVEVVKKRRDASSASVTISGRSKTCDLIDCSPDFPTTELAGLDLAAVARKVTAPFGIEVDAKATGPTFAVAAAHHGETCWKLIERLARQRQLLVMDDPEGRLVLTQLATERASDRIVHPADGLLALETVEDASKLFSVYRVKAQAGARWSEEDGGEETVAEDLAHVEGEIFDRSVTRYRPKTFLNEGAAKKVGVMARAAYEARRNKGKALRFSATFVGWRQSDGKLWVPNILVPCEAPELNLSAELAIAEVHYRKGAAGTTCELELAPPEAFTPEPPEAPAGSGEGGRWADAGSITGSGGGAG
ncbi:phage baseplate assembly protein [Reyranella sp.]|uniref:phage baseplate assembly protein n=1 Tax=Reyranella sp. TaxID=1929291 RepID=UPI003C7CF3B1